MISVVCPVYNEEKTIEQLLLFFVGALPAEKELIVVDGSSADNTRSIVLEFAHRYPEIKLLDNPDKYVSYALNKAIRVCQGDLIIRLDAHTVYAADYFEKIVATFQKTGADIVGGPMRAKGESEFQKAVATCTSTKLGVGDSRFHDETAEGYVDSVYLGAWRKAIFEKTGMFDEQMVRNQDDEFHYRAKSKGLKIYLNPEIRSWYYPRNDIPSLFSQYFQYGLYKPLVLRKVRSAIKLRHVIPSFFVLYLLMLPAAINLAGNITLIPLALYLLCIIIFMMKSGPSYSERFNYLIVYPVLHIAYGLGFLAGLFKRKGNNLT